jgi:Mg2+ and Co2+ transporter CorA
LYEEHHSIKMLDELRAYEIQIDGHLASVDLLEKRAQEILSLLEVSLNLKSQSTTVEINRNIWSLTKDTVDDSATVKLVTIVTLLYLPASFVASFLGMNLFEFQSPDGSGFQISNQFWVYFLITIPLTFLTVGSWMVMARKRKKQKLLDQEKELLREGGQEEV